MEKLDDRTLILRITKYAANQHREFYYTDMKDALQLDDDDDGYILTNLTAFNSSTENPNHILQIYEVITGKSGTAMSNRLASTYTLLPQALYNYVDYLEIVEARKAANEAKVLSLLSLRVAVWSLTLSVLVGLFGVIVQILLELSKH
jgi:hypothetical protein